MDNSKRDESCREYMHSYKGTFVEVDAQYMSNISSAYIHGYQRAEKDTKELKSENDRLKATIDRLCSGNKNMIEASLETQIDLLERKNAVMDSALKTICQRSLGDINWQSDGKDYGVANAALKECEEIDGKVF